MEEGGGGARSLVPGGPVLLVLCGLLEASGGGRALPQLSDDIPFRVNWPGTEFSLVSAPASPVAISLAPALRVRPLPSVFYAFFPPGTTAAGACLLPLSKTSFTPSIHSYSKCYRTHYVGVPSMLSIGDPAVTCSPFLNLSELDLLTNTPSLWKFSLNHGRRAHLSSLWKVRCSSSSTISLLSFSITHLPAHTHGALQIGVPSHSYSFFSLVYAHERICTALFPSELFLRWLFALRC